ncbi:MAG: amino acid ABC transporter permease, partial [Rhodospirillales bacterium]|nr:amino acid ABC transporter permease [Rhodospirillales bacterium]
SSSSPLQALVQRGHDSTELAFVRILWMSVIGCGLGFLFGFVLVYLRTTPGWLFVPLRLFMISYVEFFRRVPFLVLLFLVLFVSKGLGQSYSLFTIACISIVIISTAFIGEIIRAGLESVHANQWDTATAMNFNRIQILRHVVLPQAWKVILPPAFAFFVVFIKDTSLASQVGVMELTAVGKYFNNFSFSAILSFGSILILYFLLSYPLTRFGWWMEARIKASRAIDTRPDDLAPTPYNLRQG